MTSLIDTLIFAGGAVALLALGMVVEWGWRWLARRRAERVSLAGKVLRCHMGFAKPQRRLS